MSLRTIQNAQCGTLTLTCQPIAAFSAEVAVGDIVIASTSSNWAVNSYANNDGPQDHPMGVVKEKAASDLLTVEFWNVMAVVQAAYGSSPSLGEGIRASTAAYQKVEPSSGTPGTTFVAAVDVPASGYCQFMVGPFN